MTANETRFTRFTVLIVDDTLTNVRLLLTLLEQADCDVRVATSGKSGLLAAQLQPPDLMLIDAVLPDMDGNTLCQQLKDDASLVHVPLILVTAHTTPEAIAQAHEIGFDDYVQKPLNLREVMQKLDLYRNDS